MVGHRRPQGEGIFEQEDASMSLADNCRKSMQERQDYFCKGTKVKTCLAHLRSGKEVTATGPEWPGMRVVRCEIRK